ncbi:MAG: YceK/YidQ family lipoprotein [Gammaproteobacteria bacterium]|nr:YceK/YidQ family lipoprotein [Gammaproteobacteria bacterium]
MNKNMKYAVITVLLLFCLLLNGCASLALSFIDNKDRGAENNIYIGTRAEYKTLAFNRNTDGASIANLAAWPFALIDFPLCLVADTLLLPYTVFAWYNDSE